MTKPQGMAKGFLRWLTGPQALSFALLGVFVLLSFALASTNDQTSPSVEEEITRRINIILCPILNLLTGTIAKIIGVIFLAWAVIQYMTNDSRGAKATAIAAIIGIILILTFPTWQQLITGMQYVSNSSNECLKKPPRS
jgi:type IV secretory pathway VirB2 component (pilin)